jgi:L-rhamnonate dehydratase
VKIKKIEVFPIRLASRKSRTGKQERDPKERPGLPMARPISRYLRRGDGTPRRRATPAGQVACLITAEDGTWGLGVAPHGAPVAQLIHGHFAPYLIGENCFATEKLWDLMVRMTAEYSSTSIPAFAISAIDNALWDLKGKILQRPVYALLGGPQKDRIFCYASGPDTAWYLELGFKATKIFAPYSPDAGLEGLRKNVEYVARVRELVGAEVELMLDCWMAMNIDYAIRLAEELRPYRLK